MCDKQDVNYDEDEKACSTWLSQEEENTRTSTNFVQSNSKIPSKPSNDQKTFQTTFGFLAPEGTLEYKDNEESSVLATGQASSLGAGKAIIVNPCQRGNPVLDLIRDVPWQFTDSSIPLAVDYILGQSTCCLFLSLRYHALKPEYIYGRLKKLRQGGLFALRLLLCLVDVKDSAHSIGELTKVCLISDVTLLLAFSNEEAATYLETFKAYQNKPADSLKSRPSTHHQTRVVEVLSSIRSVNSTDANTLLNNFGSLVEISKANEEELGLCPGIGGIKARTLYNVFKEPFLKEKKME